MGGQGALFPSVARGPSEGAAVPTPTANRQRGGSQSLGAAPSVSVRRVGLERETAREARA
eukprot:355791-Chlamydomonas_euryale.AAC.5